jgi:hypothetical protein
LCPVVDGGAGQRHVDRIDRYARGRLAHLDVHGLGARQGQALEVWLELDRVWVGTTVFGSLPEVAAKEKTGSGARAAVGEERD